MDHISSSFTIAALIRLVEPLLPSGTPAVMTTVSPFCTSRSFSATSAERRRSGQWM